jgi:hypothetical protein
VTVSIPLAPGEVAKITRTGPYVFAERMQFLSPDEARAIGPTWLGRVERIQRTVAGFYGLKYADMRSPDRHRKFAWPRQRAMWLAKKLLNKPWTDLGRLFGHRDHSTVIHAIREVDKRMAKDALERAQMKRLLADLEHLRVVA